MFFSSIKKRKRKQCSVHDLSTLCAKYVCRFYDKHTRACVSSRKTIGPLFDGALPLKHLSGLTLHCSLLLHAELSWCLVAVDRVLILQCNSSLLVRTVWASRNILIILMLLQNKTSSNRDFFFFIIMASMHGIHCMYYTYFAESCFFRQDLNDMNFSSTLNPCNVCVCVYVFVCHGEIRRRERDIENDRQKAIETLTTRWQQNIQIQLLPPM